MHVLLFNCCLHLKYFHSTCGVYKYKKNRYLRIVTLILQQYFFSMARQPYMGLGLLVTSRFHNHTQLRHTTVGRTPLDEGPACQSCNSISFNSLTNVNMHGEHNIKNLQQYICNLQYLDTKDNVCKFAK
jgi:hypothetical protein